MGGEKYSKFISSSYSQCGKMLQRMKLDSLDQEHRVKAIVDYVKNNYKWNRALGNFPSESKNQLLEQKQGSAAGLNLLLTGLLKQAGIEAFPLLLSTREHGKVYNEYPLVTFFNDLIVMAVMGKDTLLTDATEPLLPYDMIPEYCLNAKKYPRGIGWWESGITPGGHLPERQPGKRTPVHCWSESLWSLV